MNRFVRIATGIALLPAMTGPLPVAAAQPLVAPLCSGGTVQIPIRAPTPGTSEAPCCAKGCHSGSRRKRLDRTQ
ncbi:hypothetical protein [Novosphingobium marinum]|uniref:Uncharacterized protein n=1 Tax=Novosphingobium marinum TaxID=1514948 RepID=A0A7Y9XYE4_9SPHN|nr:hypothetical protein [Novosphingobium marinum]NYH95558.1 hypothetical protein [Novosphingobium marinum]